MISLPLAICLAAPALSEAVDPDGLLPVSIPKLSTEASSAAGFAPRGWKVENSLKGDLNKDGKPDLVVILKGVDPACRIAQESGAGSLDTNPRLLVVAFQTARGYSLRVANASIIPRQSDPYAVDSLEDGGLSIRGGVLRLRLGHWRSMGGWGSFSNSFSFRWDGAAFRLIGFDHDYLHRGSGETETISANFLTGKARITKGFVQDNIEVKSVWKTLPRQSVATLETFGDGLQYRSKH